MSFVFKSSATGMLALFLAAAAAPRPAAAETAAAETAPDFHAATLAGDTLQLASFRGRVVLLDFWATWCPPCRGQLERLAALEKQIPDLVVLAVSVDSRRDKVERFVRRSTLPERVLLDPTGAVAARYGLQGMPWTVVVDVHGNVASARGGWGASDLPQLAAEVRRLQGHSTGGGGR